MVKKSLLMLLIAGIIALGVLSGGARAGFFDDLAKKAEKFAADQGYEEFENSDKAVEEWGELRLINSNGETFELRAANRKNAFAKFAKLIDAQEGKKWWQGKLLWYASHNQGSSKKVVYTFAEVEHGDDIAVAIKDIVVKNRHHANADDDFTYNEWEIAEHVKKMFKGN